MRKQLFNQDQIPYICTPLTGTTTEEVLAELTTILSKKPDVLEWRVDFFNDIDKSNKVLATLQEIYSLSSGLPLLFTIRSQHEGGQKIPLNEDQVFELLAEVCESDFVEMIDYEASNNIENIQHLKEVSNKHNKKLVLSFHDFTKTPSKEEIIQCLTKMANYGADVAKVAVMPNSHEDVITLLEATKEAADLLDIPLIAISMGDIGVMSRLLGWLYGSVLTFAVGEKSSAPGQISIETLREMILLMKQKRNLK